MLPVPTTLGSMDLKNLVSEGGNLPSENSSSNKEFTCSAGDTEDTGLIPGSGRSPGGGHGNSLQYSCQGSLVGYGPWSCKESDITEAT